MKNATNCACSKPLSWSDRGGMCGDCRDAALQRTMRKKYSRAGTPQNPQQGVSEKVESQEKQP